MKKLIWLVLFALSSVTFKAQEYLTKDTLRKNEISLSVLPVVSFFSGSFEPSVLTNFNLSYKYYFKNNYVFRSAIVLFPKAFNSPYGAGLVFYDRTIGPNNIFYSESVGGSIKSQLNLGVEKIYKVNRLMHGFGVDAFVNHSLVNYGVHYFYRAGYISNNNFYIPGDTTNYNVDSLGYHRSERKIGVGVQVFYSVRYKISKRFYLSATVGPSFNFSFVKGSSYNNRTQQSRNYTAFDFNFPNVGFISDVSICFRL
ncbi:MAG: hypothetical protein H0W61_09600 [Bacteroidetes bacterium]|nr:hypothetical protein [Bacteroidota bacterium]